MEPHYDSNFIVVTTKITGNLTISGNFQYNSVDAKTVTVSPGVRARVYGNIETLVVEQGSKIFVHGTIGEIIDKGGRVYHFLQE